jgi:hypothetical protein
MKTIHEKRMCGIRGPAQEAYVSCVLGLYGVHRFESPRLSDISNRLFVVLSK